MNDHENGRRFLANKRMGKWMFRIILLFIFLISITFPVKAVSTSDNMTSNLICPCECGMIISTCSCPTAVQVNNEIIQMKESGFSEEQIFKVLKAEYGVGILAPQERFDSKSLFVAGVFSFLIIAFIGYLATRKPNPDIIPVPDRKQYEQRFEEEYRKFVSEMVEP